MTPVRFTTEDAQRAYDEWDANCGPGAIAGIMGMTLDELRPHLGDFEKKGYTNPTLMREILRNIKAPVSAILTTCKEEQELRTNPWPYYGLARVQWEGPWTAPGVPMRVRYRHTHWVGTSLQDGERRIFDINCMCVGGWVSLSEWTDSVVPWLLRQCEPKANGLWHLTHAVEIKRPC